MRRHLPIRLLACAALAGSASLAAVAGPALDAGAVTPLTVTCTAVSGSASSQAVSGCTGKGAIAADAGTPPAHGTSVASTHEITWSNHKTTVTKYTYTPASDASCPTVPKYSKFLLENAKGTVVKSAKVGTKTYTTTTTGMINGAFTGTICVYKLTAAPHTILVKNKGSFKI